MSEEFARFRRHPITDLNLMPSQLIARLRGLLPVPRTKLFWNCVDYDQRSYMASFFKDVVDGGADPRTWGWGGYLAPALSPFEVVTASTESILAILEPWRTGGWQRVPHRDRAHSSWLCGAPVIPRPDLHYSQRLPEGVCRYRDLPVEPCDDIHASVAGWMAFSITILIGDNRIPDTPEGVAAAVGIDLADLSPDALDVVARAAADPPVGGCAGIAPAQH